MPPSSLCTEAICPQGSSAQGAGFPSWGHLLPAQAGAHTRRSHRSAQWNSPAPRAPPEFPAHASESFAAAPVTQRGSESACKRAGRGPLPPAGRGQPCLLSTTALIWPRQSCHLPAAQRTTLQPHRWHIVTLCPRHPSYKSKAPESLQQRCAPCRPASPLQETQLITRVSLSGLWCLHLATGVQGSPCPLPALYSSGTVQGPWTRDWGQGSTPLGAHCKCKWSRGVREEAWGVEGCIHLQIPPLRG